MSNEDKGRISYSGNLAILSLRGFVKSHWLPRAFAQIHDYWRFYFMRYRFIMPVYYHAGAIIVPQQSENTILGGNNRLKLGKSW